MRDKALIAGVIATLAVLAAAIGVVGSLFINRFDDIELDRTSQRAAQALQALEADLNQLAVSTRDYAEWDDAQQFIVDGDTSFLRANFSFDSLDGMQVDMMAIVDAGGEVLYSAAVDASARRLVSPTPELLKLLMSLHSREPELRRLSSLQRLVQVSHDIVAFSIVGISRSDKSERTGATLIFARFLQDDELQRIRATSRMPVQLVNLGASSGSSLPQALLSRRPGEATSSEIQSKTNTVGYALIADLTGRPIGYLTTLHLREIGNLGRRTTWFLMGTIAILLLAAGLALTLLILQLRRSWMERLAMEMRHRNILRQLDESVALADPYTGEIVDANDALLRVLDYRREELPLLTLRNIYVDLPEVFRPGTAPSEHRMRARDGRIIEEEITLTQIQEGERSLVCIVGRDLTQRRQAAQALLENEQRLAHQAQHDSLTDLPNRAYLHARLPQLLHEMARHEQSAALFHVDIDNFKHVNESRGHGLGDRLLQIVARRLCAAVGANDLVLRIGGDEFVIVAPATSPQAVRARAQNLLTTLRAPVVLDEIHLSLTASIGVALYPQDGIDAETLLKHADIALYQAKEQGRDSFQAFSNDMSVQLREHVVIEQALRRAIDTEEIYLEYQPIVDLQTGLLMSFEALARWRHPELGPVPPGRFIPVAEKSGLVIPLGAQIVRQVIAQLAQWREAGLLLAPVAVNVAPVQFERTNFANFVHETALDFDITPSWLSFEVTESAWLQNSSKHVVMIDTLRHEGSKVYIDDFGTGFSNLSYLKTLPIDAIKIDQAFVRGIETDPSDAAIVTGIIAMARQLSIETIAEGIETAAQAERLRMLGCSRGQGYYFSRPMAPAQCRALLEQLRAARELTQTVTMRAFRHVSNQ